MSARARARYLGTPRGTVKAKPGPDGKKTPPKGDQVLGCRAGDQDEPMVSFKAFSGYFRKASNSLILLSLFM